MNSAALPRVKTLTNDVKSIIRWARNVHNSLQLTKLKIKISRVTAGLKRSHKRENVYESIKSPNSNVLIAAVLKCKFNFNECVLLYKKKVLKL